MAVKRLVVLSCMLFLQFMFGNQVGCNATRVLDNSRLNELDKPSRSLEDPEVSALISSDITVDSEGLTPLRQRAAMHDMTPNGEKRNEVKLPEPLDENSEEERVQEKQRLKIPRDTTITGEKRDSEISDDELHQLIVKALCRGTNGLDKSATCQMIKKRQYRRMLSREKRKYSVKKVQWEKGIVPYAFDKEFEETHAGKKAIIRAMKYIESVSCVRFVEYFPGVHEKLRLNHTSYLNFINKGDRRCWSNVGRSGKEKQDISACGKFFVASHELLHALGSEHEQSRADREKWIQILVGNIKPGHTHNFLRVSDTRTFGTKYDYGSVMHYSAYGFSRNGYPTIAVYDRDLRFLIGRRGLLSHEDIMALNRAYQCQATKCPMFSDVCQNSGFVGYKDKKCQCICPDGLMGKTCEETFKPGKLPTEWPSGTYGIPQPASGCPSRSWKNGSRNQTLNCCAYPTKGFHMKQGTWGRRYMNHQFCMRETGGPNPVTWMPGRYCIYKKGKCPHGFEVGSIKFDIVYKTGKNNVIGVVPDGSYGKETKFYYCCRNDGEVEIPIRLPVSKPFYLFMSRNASTCQAVEGARFFEEQVMYSKGDNSTRAVEGHHPKLNRIARTLMGRYQLYYCYYEPMSYACGGIISLTKSSSSRTIKTPHYPSNYDDNMECYWLIKSPADTQIQVSMDDFDVEEGLANICIDSLEIRHHSIAQPGPRYCGSYFPRSLTSNYNSMMLIFRSSVDNGRKGFSAKVSIVTNSRYNCYDISNLGKTYAGKVNYTRDYRRCISWSAAARCPLNLWNMQFFMTEDHNYCRNPIGAEQPWCYVNATTCELDLCDVCGINVCYDRIETCAIKLKDVTNYCSTEEGFTKCHKTCGLCGKAIAKKVKSCSQPPAPQNASFVPGTLKWSYNIGDRIQYKCNTGFGIHGRVCMSDGSWSGSTKMCAACPYKWKAEGKSCFRKSEAKATWEDAEAACKEMGAHLASPSNMQQQKIMESLLKYKNFWIGYNDKRTEGKWEWSDGSKNNFTLWDPGYPKTEEWGNCAAVSPAEGHGLHYRGWYDFRCNDKKYYVCEGIIATCEDIVDCQGLMTKYPDMCTKHKSYAASRCRLTCGFCGPNMTTTTSPPTSPATTTSAPTITCLSGWIAHGNTCYKLFTNKKTAWAAYQDCMDRSAQLIIIEDKAKDDLVRRWLSKEGAQNTWMGLTDENHEGKWVWNSTGEIANYTGWYASQPNNYKGNQHCAWFYYRMDYQWGDDVCSKLASYICQTTQPRVTTESTAPTRPVDICKTSWTKHGSSCYKIFKDVLEDWSNFETAQRSCKENGAYLVKISDETENTFLKNQLDKVKAYNVWIGLTDRLKEGEFRWTKDNSTVAYTDWAKWQPSNTGQQHCVSMYQSYKYRWNDNSCSSNFGFICEYDLLVPVKTSPTTGTVASTTAISTILPAPASTLSSTGCFSGWTEYSGSCYLLVSDKKDAMDANQDCLDRGAVLAVIDNKREDDFLRQWLNRKISLDAWIGLTDEKEENKWVWRSTGKVPTYTGWGPGRPSTKHSNFKDCTYMNFLDKYSWRDTFCSLKAYYICETLALTTTTEKATTTVIAELPSTTKTAKLSTSAETTQVTMSAPRTELTTAPTEAPVVSKPLRFGHTAKQRNHKDSWKHASLIPEPSDQITCSGFVIGWQVYFVRRKPVYLQIWRPQGKNIYQLVEETFVPPHLGLIAINLDPSEQIPIQKGDVLGLYFGLTNPVPFDGQTCGRGHVLYNRKNTRYTFAGDTATFENKTTSWKPCRVYSMAALIKKDTKSCTTRREISTSRKKASALRRLLKDTLQFGV